MIAKQETPEREPMSIDSEGKSSSEDEKEERADWSPEQDNYLKGLVNAYGPHNWVSISEYMNAHFSDKRKSSKQCRERWCNKLDPTINHCPWTKQEEATLILSHMKFKNRWCDIVSTLKGRHNNMIKNRFYSIFRKVKNKVKNNDFSYSSKLELIEMHYMICVMEEYAANPLPPDEPKRKRGKDFMYTLIEDIDMPMLQKYKEALTKKCPLKVPLGQLLQEILFSPNPIQSGERPVHRIQMPLGEAMDCGTASQHSMTPGPNTPGRANLMTLPLPRSFCSKEPLTPDEKDFVRQHLFYSAKTDTHSPSSFAQAQPMMPFQAETRPAPIQGYYSSGTGGVMSNMHVVNKGGFGDLSKATSLFYRPPMPMQMPMMAPLAPTNVLPPPPPAMPTFQPRGKSLFYTGEMWSNGMPHTPQGQ